MKELLHRFSALLEQEEGTFSSRAFLKGRKRRLSRAAKEFSRAQKRGETIGESARWLLDNLFLLRALLHGGVRKNLRLSCGTHALLCRVTAEGGEAQGPRDFAALFEFFRARGISHEDLVKLPLSLVCALFDTLTQNLDSPDTVRRCILSLREVSRTDFSALISAHSPLEALLRRDASGTFSKMDTAFRARLCEDVSRAARRRGMETPEFAKELLRSSRGGYVGEKLEKKSRLGLVYSIALTLTSVLISGACTARFLREHTMGAATFLGFLLVGAAVGAAAIAVFDSIFSKFVKQRPLWRVHLEKLPDSARTMVVYPALVSSVEDIDELCARLEEAYFASFVHLRGDENLSFALLLDLPEAPRPTLPEDSVLYAAARERVQRLNRENKPCFYLFSRARVHTPDGTYSGYERKRGALLSLSAFLCRGEGELRLEVGERERIERVKYLLTLDSDTVLTPGAVQKLVGVAEHPLNTPVLEKRRGVSAVKRGYAVFQPLVVPTPESAGKTPFSVLRAGAGGMSAYATAAFDRAQTLFSQGIFCGKGLINLPVFDALLTDAFPDHAVLSHDLLEGARLSCAAVTDVVLLDEVPSTPRAESSRAHRWARGDVQALFFTARSVKDRFGVKRHNPITNFYRMCLWDNLRRLLLAPTSALLLLLSPFLSGQTQRICVLAALSVYAVPAALDVLYLLFTTRGQALFSRFVSPISGGIWQRILSALYDVSALFEEARGNLDAVFRALWRMQVSGKKRLEWRTAAMSAKGRETLFSYVKERAFSILCGLFLLACSSFSVVRLCAVLAVLHPLFAYLLSRKFKERVPKFTRKNTLKRYACAQARFFLNEVGEHTNHLPPDHRTFHPVDVRAMRTSPTNIGLYLTSICAMVDLGVLTVAEALLRIRNTVGTLEKLPTWHSLLYNWYDVEHLTVIGGGYVSSVDCGNYLACLGAVRGFLLECREAGVDVEEILSRVTQLYEAGNLKPLYHAPSRLFSIGYDTQNAALDTSFYDLYMSEARLTSFLAVARGQVPPAHWSALSRALISEGGYLGAAAFSGTVFEYFMPSLFLPAPHASFEKEALYFAARASRRAARHSKVGAVFGVSESAFFASDATGDYPYRANGIPTLALRRDVTGEDVVSPYSSFLMLPALGDAALENLRRLEKLGLYGEYGFFEAAQIVHGEAQVVESVFAHHAGMSIVAAANALYDGVFCRRFFKNRECAAFSALLAERIPADGVLHPVQKLREKTVKRPHAKKTSMAINPRRAEAICIPSRSASLVYRSDGYLNVIFKEGGGVTLARPASCGETGGLVCRALVDGVVYSTNPEENPAGASLRLYRRAGGFLIAVEHEKRRVLFTLSLSGTQNALSVVTRVCGGAGKVRVALSFAALLVPQREYFAHPAYTALSLSASRTHEAFFLTARARGKREEFALALCDECEENRGVPHVLYGDALQEAGGARKALVSGVLQGGVSGALSSPEVLFSRTLSCPEYRTEFSHRFVLGFGRGTYPARACCRHVLCAAQDSTERRRDEEEAEGFFRRAEESAQLCDVCAPTCLNVTHAVLNARALRLLPSSGQTFFREELYRLSLSGDEPIVLCRVTKDTEDSLCRTLASLHRYHALSSLKYDLVFFCREQGYLRTSAQRAHAAIHHSASEYLYGCRGGVFVIEGGEREEELLQNAACITLGTDAFAAGVKKERELSTDVGGIPEVFFRIPPAPSGSGTRFVKEGVLIEKDVLDPVPSFSHLLSSRTFGALVTHRSLGFSFATSSRFRRLTRVDNDAFLPSFGERLVLKYRQRHYDLAAVSSKVLFSPGSAQYFGKLGKVQWRITVFCHPTLLVRGVQAEFFSEKEERITLSYEFEPVLGEENGVLGGFFTHRTENMLLVLRAVNPTHRPLRAFLLAEGAPARRAGEGVGLAMELDLKQKKSALFYLGAYETEEALRFTANYLRSVPFSRLFCEATEAARADLPAPVLFEGSEDKRAFVNRWLPYQALVSRMRARCGLYQPGGAFGFRDQLQDALMFLTFSPEQLASTLLRHAAHQFREGDVLHWWHNLPDEKGRHRGVRTHISDDYLWLIFAAEKYVTYTGDLAFLERRVPFLEGRELHAGEKDLYDAFSFGEKASMWEHLFFAADLFVARGVGKHSLALMLGGDWNDGFDALGEGAESVFLSQFGSLTLRRFVRLMEKAGVEQKRGARYLAFCRVLEEGVQNAFSGGFFARAYFGDGEALGADPTLSTPCSIDALPQAFAAFCFADLPEKERTQERKERVESALDAAYRHLYDRENKLFKLFTPPFPARGREVGYIRAYADGVRENGGQYTHAAVWYALACRAFAPLSSNEALWRERGDQVLDAVLPYRAASQEEVARRYRLEPYALCGDVWSAPGQEGRGGWSHYTGSAAWAWRAFAEENPM